MSSSLPNFIDYSLLHENLRLAGFQECQLKDANLWFCEKFFPDREASKILDTLIESTEWTQPVIRLGAKSIPSPRLAAWFGDEKAIYTYSGVRNSPAPWTPVLQKVRIQLEKAIGSRFNSVLLNYYRSGQDSMGWHRDNERELGPEPLIASVSLGERRRFLMQHVKDKKLRWKIELCHGSALIMMGQTQNLWRHCLPKSKTRNNSRVNLTFRQIF